MKLPRRKFLHLAAAVLPALPGVAWAQTYPSRPVRLIVPFPAGGVIDLFGRLMGQWLSERLGQPFVIENRAGAGGNLGAEFVVRSPADGYTLLQLSSVNAFGVSLYDNLSFNLVQDLAPVASIYSAPTVLIANQSFPAKSVPALIAHAKGNPGKVTMASAGVGTADHVFGELFKSMAGIDMLHVPYRGGAPKMTDLIAGQVDVTFEPIATAMEQIKAGRVHALAVTSTKRVDALPNVPPVNEFIPGYEGLGWQGIAAPRNTPTPIIAALNREINAGLSDPRIKARIADLGATVLAGTPADSGAFVTHFTEKWAKVIREAKIKAE